MKTSAVGINLIKRNEGCELTAYLDQIADPPVWTIGYGDTLGIHEGMTITAAEAEARLVARLAREFEPAVNAVLEGSPTSQPQFDAMISLSWNIGSGAFTERCSVPRYHRLSNYARAADAFLLWNQAGGQTRSGLTRRRNEERSLYLSVLPAPAPLVADQVIAKMRAAQMALRDAGYDPGPIDGDPGPKTRAAMTAYRQVHHL